MNAILGFTQVLKRDKDMSKAQRDRLNIIHESGNHLLSLINDVLDSAKIEAGKIEINNRNFHFSNAQSFCQKAGRQSAYTNYRYRYRTGYRT